MSRCGLFGCCGDLLVLLKAVFCVVVYVVYYLCVPVWLHVFGYLCSVYGCGGDVVVVLFDCVGLGDVEAFAVEMWVCFSCVWLS